MARAPLAVACQLGRTHCPKSITAGERQQPILPWLWLKQAEVEHQGEATPGRFSAAMSWTATGNAETPFLAFSWGLGE